MGTSANILSIEALDDLRKALLRFHASAAESIGEANIELRRTQDWLEERRSYWQSEVRKMNERVARASADLARCQASGYRDKNGIYHAPICSEYVIALRKAQIDLQYAVTELQNVNSWANKIQKAVNDYKVKEIRLTSLFSNLLPKATSLLERSILIISLYTSLAPALLSFGTETENDRSASSENTAQIPDGNTEVTWSQQQAILQRVQNGETISPEELHILTTRASDLKAGTLVNDDTWIRQAIEWEKYHEITSELWLEKAPEANQVSIIESLLSLAAITLKLKRFWKDKGALDS